MMEDKNIEQTTTTIKAVALKYDIEKDSAPSLVAKGKGETASNIIKLAKEHDIPIKKDEDLVELLSQIDIEKEIPGSMYKAVAEIFSFIYDLSNKNKEFMDNYEEKNLK
jgi:flagellar biosynthesis protein